MKSLILLILFGVATCVGQENKFAVTGASGTIGIGAVTLLKGVMVYVPDEKSQVWNMGKEYLTVVIVKLYDAYAKECYADSTTQTYNIYIRNGHKYYALPSSEDVDLGIDVDYRGQEQVWEHKQPTFSGFIEFLRSKIKTN